MRSAETVLLLHSHEVMEFIALAFDRDVNKIRGRFFILLK